MNGFYDLYTNIHHKLSDEHCIFNLHKSFSNYLLYACKYSSKYMCLIGYFIELISFINFGKSDRICNVGNIEVGCFNIAKKTRSNTKLARCSIIEILTFYSSWEKLKNEGSDRNKGGRVL